MTLKYNIDFCAQFVQKYQGICLSQVYEKTNKHLLWQCKNKHIFKKTLEKILKGQWCKECYEISRKITKEKCIELAKQRDGWFLENQEIKNSKQLLKWKCKDQHEFLACFNNVQQKCWCPICAEIQRENTRIEKYGFPYLMQNKELRKKANIKMNKIVKIKHWFSEEIIHCHGGFEIAVIEWLNKKQINYNKEYETFIMPDGRTYTPDLYFPEKNLWIEIKGYWYGDAKEKWDWFHKEYVNSELWNEAKLKELGLWNRIIEIRKEQRKIKTILNF